MKRLLILTLGACALAGNLKADVVESHGYYLSSEDVGKLDVPATSPAPLAVDRATTASVSPAKPVSTLAGDLTFCLVLVVVIFLYFIPTICGSHKRNAGAIFVLNLLLGWSFIGWVIALVWACISDPKPVILEAK